jgi:hypothetical protein
MSSKDRNGKWRFFQQRNLFVQAIDVKRRLDRAGGLIKLLGRTSAPRKPSIATC